LLSILLYNHVSIFCYPHEKVDNPWWSIGYSLILITTWVLSIFILNYLTILEWPEYRTHHFGFLLHPARPSTRGFAWAKYLVQILPISDFSRIDSLIYWKDFSKIEYVYIIYKEKIHNVNKFLTFVSNSFFILNRDHCGVLSKSFIWTLHLMQSFRVIFNVLATPIVTASYKTTACLFVFICQI